MSNENVLEALREINTKLGAIRSGLPNPIQYKTDPVRRGRLGSSLWRTPGIA